MKNVTRRTFIASMGAASVVPPAALLTEARAALRAHPAPESPSYCFFQLREARFIELACERLIPSDQGAPGAFGPEITAYMDRQLAGPWGSGERLYRTGPWQPGSLPSGASFSNPATMFRIALHAIDRGFETHGTCFSDLDPASQGSFLRSLAAEGLLLDGVPAVAFFDLLLAMTVEGFLSGSSHAPDRGVIAWPLKGFPGGYFRHGSGNVDVGLALEIALCNCGRG